MSPTSTADQVTAVLAGELRYDDVGDDAQALVRAAWEADIDRHIAGLDLEATFRAEGRPSWVSSVDGTPITVFADQA